MEDQDIDELINRAVEKQNLIENFLKLTEKQTEAIKNDNFDSILKTINKKQTIIEQVNLLKLNYQSAVVEDNESLRLINNKTIEIMSRAIAIDDNNILSLKNSQAQIFEKLKNAKKNKTTHNTYRGKNLSVEGILLDKKK